MTGGTLQSLLEQSLGALFVGILVAAILLGITNLQTYVYFKSYPNDWLHYKLAVVFLWCLDTLHFVLAAHAVYWYLVMHFDEISLHLPIVWSFKLQLVLNLLTILMVQSLYAFRLWKVSSSQKRRTAAYLVIALVVCNYGMTTATCYFIYQVHAITDVQHYCWMIYSIYGTGILVDFAIVAAFCWTIAQHRNGHPNSDSIINRLIVYVVASGVLTSIFTIVCLATFAASPQSYVSFGIAFSLNKLYVNSFMAVLNSRDTIRHQPPDGEAYPTAACHRHRGIEFARSLHATRFMPDGVDGASNDTCNDSEEKEGQIASPTGCHNLRQMKSIEIMIEREAFTHVD